ncbi:hypothetical protein SISNIDRAFT_463323 [Sistotremastrum niveocremeum HHB9708]|uniref:Uncharacterized protein n=1 Tax=Sistotremastrum niveocremeum HHB9708 TaxID=1314777 RepID=A0A164Z0V8_9AGAM|nr:hypothetical protein SISNIDRAFT_463323 [Sistotremastrum niveocremeum HHB9708]
MIHSMKEKGLNENVDSEGRTAEGHVTRHNSLRLQLCLGLIVFDWILCQLRLGHPKRRRHHITRSSGSISVEAVCREAMDKRDVPADAKLKNIDTEGEELTDGKSECYSGYVFEWRLLLDAATRPKAFSVTLCGTAQSFALKDRRELLSYRVNISIRGPDNSKPLNIIDGDPLLRIRARRITHNIVRFHLYIRTTTLILSAASSFPEMRSTIRKWSLLRRDGGKSSRETGRGDLGSY